MKYILVSEKLSISAKEQALKKLDAEYLSLQEGGVVYLHEGKEYNISIEDSNFENILFIYRCINDMTLAEENIALLNEQVNIFSSKGDLITLKIDEFKKLSQVVFRKKFSLDSRYMLSKAIILNDLCS
jgi:hypothetical protein